jgi:hypothetical protein
MITLPNNGRKEEEVSGVEGDQRVVAQEEVYKTKINVNRISGRLLIIN